MAVAVFIQSLLLEGLNVGVLDKILRAGEGKTLRKLEGIARTVNAIEQDFVDLTDEELRALTEEFKQRFAEGETLDDLMPEAFATVREAAKRTLGQRHYDVQIMVVRHYI
jgi:preprotein translocase subunit SecA